MNNGYSSKRRLVVLSGAPKTDGVTQQMLDTFLAAAPENITVEVFSLFREHIHSCTDCGACTRRPGCIWDGEDRFAAIAAAALHADVLAVAAPVYFLSYPAPLKAFCDRLQTFFTRHVAEKHPFDADVHRKNGVLLCCCGATDPFALKTMKAVTQMVFSCLNARLTGDWMLFGTDEKERDKLFQSAEDAANNLWKNLVLPFSSTQK